MKKIITLAAFFFLLGFKTSFAQVTAKPEKQPPPPPPHEEPKRDLPCQIARDITNHLEKASERVPAPVREQVKDVVRQAEDTRKEACGEKEKPNDDGKEREE